MISGHNHPMHHKASFLTVSPTSLAEKLFMGSNDFSVAFSGTESGEMYSCHRPFISMIFNEKEKVMNRVDSIQNRLDFYLSPLND
ncbi:hypothetical protein JTE90_021886 [Oedothorax gibbosus]|uniref:Uncharacterized protein n=1 Tax=Oedothorax gibbosus TaxID=931172 RepID=A0AAV6V0V3_9ARAC|nr:hypothetical protein JTE90_021886 [Oedothorax gibbosus]